MLLLILGAFLMLGISIFIHELGHLLCGMLVGVQARIFSIGYGRGIWRKRIGKTIYQITGIPLGGYVLFRGDQYGKRLKGKKGELLSTPPLKRMIPVIGGPLFNFFLGFAIFFILALLGDHPPDNRIYIDKSTREYSPAFRGGLRTGDKIISINGKKTESFEDIFTEVGLSAGEELKIQYERKGNNYNINIHPEMFNSGGRPTIGIEPSGERRVIATFTYGEQFRHWLKTVLSSKTLPGADSIPKIEESIADSPEYREIKEKELEAKLKSRAISFLKDGDEILSVEGEEVYTVGELQSVLGKFQDREVSIKLQRKTLPLLNPWSKEEVTVSAPVRGAYIFEFRALKDNEISELGIPALSFYSYDPKFESHLSRIKINGKDFKNLEGIKSYLLDKDNSKVLLEIGDLKYTAQFHLRPIGLLGFKPSMKFDTDKGTRQVGILEAAVISWQKVYQNVSSSLLAMKMIFSGLISARENLSGPIGIVQYAGISLEYGFFTYLDFVARISIALMIMNLLPIPVADGGHLVLYLYEAIVGRPLPMRVIETIFKIGFIFLLGLGILVSFNDVLRLF